MKIHVMTVFACLAVTAFSGTVKLGDTREMVLGSLGQPRGVMKGGEIEILLFADGTVELRDGIVEKVTVPQQEAPALMPSPAVAPSAIVLRYSFDEPGGTIHDHSGHGNTATARKAVHCPEGKYDGAYEFNGSDAYMEMSHDLNLSQPYTVTAWVYLKSRLEDTADYAAYRGRTILARGDLNRSGAWDYIFNVNAYGKLGFVTHSAFSRADALQNPEVFPLNQWVFVAFTHEGDIGRLYQDGRLVRTRAHMSAGDRHRARGTYVGKIFNTHLASRGDHFWDGMIDELRVYGKALSQEALTAVQREQPPVADDTADKVAVFEPVFHLSFDDGTCKDTGSSGNHGKQEGGARATADAVKGKAMKLDGLDACISVQRNERMTLGPRDDRSVLLWWKADLIDEQTQSLLSMRARGDSQRGLSVDLFKGKYYRLHLQFYHHADFPVPLRAGQWNHLAVVKNGTDWALYHNGQLLTDPVTGGWPFTDHANAEVPLWIGRDHANGNLFSGSIDEALFFDRAISAAEVEQIYSSRGAPAQLDQPAPRRDAGPPQPKYPREDELLGAWQLAEVKGDDPNSPLMPAAEIGKLRVVFSKPPMLNERMTCKWLPGANDADAQLPAQTFTVRVEGQGILRMSEVGEPASQPDLLFRAHQEGRRLLLNMTEDAPDVWMYFEPVK